MSLIFTLPNESFENKKYKHILKNDIIDGTIFWEYDFIMIDLPKELTLYPIEILLIITEYTKDINIQLYLVEYE